MTTKKSIGFSNSNLYFNSFGKDSKGNSVIKISFPNSRAFSIQTNGNLPNTHKIKMEYPKLEEVPSADLKVVEKEVTNYIKEYGSDSQIKKLSSYAEGGEIDKELKEFARLVQKEGKFSNTKEKNRYEELTDILWERYDDEVDEDMIETSLIEIYKKQNKGGSTYAEGGEIGDKIKDWYTKNYPTDDLGEEMNDTATFEDLWNGLNERINVYDVMGVGDSVIRERLFEQLSKIKKVDYQFVYHKWLDTDGMITDEELKVMYPLKTTYAKGSTIKSTSLDEVIGSDKSDWSKIDKKSIDWDNLDKLPKKEREKIMKEFYKDFPKGKHGFKKGGSTYQGGGEIDEEAKALRRKIQAMRMNLKNPRIKSGAISKASAEKLKTLQNQLKDLEAKGAKAYAEGGEMKDKYAVGVRLFTEDEDDDSIGYGYIHIYASSPKEALAEAKRLSQSDEYVNIMEDTTMPTWYGWDEEYSWEINDDDDENPYLQMAKGGSTYAEGGGVKTNSKSVREAIRKEILGSVYDENEEEFDNFNDAAQYLADEFKRVADYPTNMSNIPNNQDRFQDYLAGLPFRFEYENYKIEEFLNGLGINPKGKKYTSDQMQKLYSYLIWREISDKYNNYAKGGSMARGGELMPVEYIDYTFKVSPSDTNLEKEVEEYIESLFGESYHKKQGEQYSLHSVEWDELGYNGGVSTPDYRTFTVTFIEDSESESDIVQAIRDKFKDKINISYNQPYSRSEYAKGGSMARGGEVEGTYGRSKTETTIYTYEERGGTWYVADGSVNVNFTYDTIDDGVDIEELTDEDMFTASSPIESVNDLENAVDSDEEDYAEGGNIPEGYHQMPNGEIMPDSAHYVKGGSVKTKDFECLTFLHWYK